VTYRFTESFKVRDYECDLQGIVNNAIYQNYLEHTRHEFLLQQGIDFSELTREGIHLVVVRAEIDYKVPLTSGDHFYVGLNVHMRDRIRIVFEQNIHRKVDDRLCIAARITGTSLNRKGRPAAMPDLVNKICK